MTAPKFTAACVLVINPENPNEFLGVARKHDSTVFGLPGGKAEADETVPAAAIREAKEETGLDLKNLKLVYYRVDENKNLCCTYSAEIIEGSSINPQPGEAAVKWVTRDVLNSGPFGKYNTNLFEQYDKATK